MRRLSLRIERWGTRAYMRACIACFPSVGFIVKFHLSFKVVEVVMATARYTHQQYMYSVYSLLCIMEHHFSLLFPNVLIYYIGCWADDIGSYIDHNFFCFLIGISSAVFFFYVLIILDYEGGRGIAQSAWRKHEGSTLVYKVFIPFSLFSFMCCLVVVVWLVDHHQSWNHAYNALQLFEFPAEFRGASDDTAEDHQTVCVTTELRN